MALVLRELTDADERAFFAGLADWDSSELDGYTFAWRLGMAYVEMLEILRRDKAGIDLDPGRVPHTMLHAVVEGEIVGRVSVRHELNEELRKRHGHLGYAVAARHRRKGYASEMLRQALDYCRTLGIGPVLLTCSDANVASWKVIEKAGGVLEGTEWDEEEVDLFRRYWIQL